MKKRVRPFIVGNWKMNPATLARAEKIWVDVQKGLVGRKGQSDVAIAPPLPFIIDLKEMAGPQKIEFVSQDVSFHPEGAHTGEVSVSQLRSFGVKCSIVGHSERRADGETDQMINRKVLALHEVKSSAIICVGEKSRDSTGDYFNVVEDQLSATLAGVKVEDLSRVIIAYEPVWAIGSGKNANASQVEEMKLFIQKVLSDIYPREKASMVRIIYGGSVNEDNAEELLKVGTVDGFLIGGASLDAKEFVSIIKIADDYARFV
ncbi:triose-phosphate isomerase [Candidatus Nomurabacteria bacterium]|nr:triose-phosphate isomerase [Candidatus Nomurabacteria bacterium]